MPVSTKGQFMIYNWAQLEGASIASNGAAVGDKLIANVLSPDPDLMYQTNATSVTITLTLPTAQLIGGWVLNVVDLDVDSDVLVSIEDDAVEVYSETVPAYRPLYDIYELPIYSHSPYGYPTGSEIDPLPRDVVSVFPDAVVGDKISWTVANADGISISHVIASPVFQSECSFEWGAQPEYLLSPNLVHAPSGMSVVAYDPMKRVSTITWPLLTDSESQFLKKAVQYAVTKKSPILVNLYPDVENPTRNQQNQFVGYIIAYEAPKNYRPGDSRTSITVAEVQS